MLARPWSRLTLAGKIVLPLVGLLIAAIVLLLFGLMTGILPAILGFAFGALEANIGIVRFVAAATAILLMTVPTAFIIIRLGPNRVGPWGTLQSTIHGLKVLAKEDFTPTGADVPVFTLAPAVVYLAPILSLLVIPFAPGLIGQDMNIALLYLFSVAGLSVLGLLMGGWSSYNKYSLLGGLRAAAMMISYEIPLTLSVVGVVLLARTMSLNGIVLAQSGGFWDWFVFQQPLAFLIFFMAAAAEGNRAPFDFAEADSEIVAGFATEYSGMRFGFFFFAEYVGVFVLSALTAVLFFGGWHAPIDVGGLLANLGVTINPALDLGQLGIWLLILVMTGPVLATLLLAIPIWMLRSEMPFWKALVIGFLLFNLFAMVGVLVWLAVSFEAVIGLIWFLVKTYAFVFTFVWMRGVLPRARVDQLMGFAWKWLLPASLLNLFVTAAAILITPGAPR